ncbi:monosaccharide ABC transporter ATP-binding protein, CUT2 family [Microbacterium pygmaeum]|uniref:Monosaccharide ABC transporter ATP-binding protein, CUT2 family n=2 Tax=Microbacterium pygmaeum TaxID=370764 RepID=A0A1G7W8L5_9MICO|nr:monosaccharide ABC transporter ATP-binding protein, CUT2 family [Microbacterium pygmaeum]
MAQVTNPQEAPDGGLTPAIRLRDLRKTYVEGVPVLEGVDLDVPHGQVTALVGANGSGKSTLVKILSGYHAPDRGSRIWIDGAEIEGQIAPAAARDAGLRFVHQDARLVSGVSVLDNMLVGAYHTGISGRVHWRSERRSVQALLDRWRIEVALDADPSNLPLATVSKLAVLRALRTEGDEKISALILDEPTAALGNDDSHNLLTWVRELAARERVGVLFIGHRLPEILSLADRVAVLRAGRIVAEEAAGELDEARLVHHVVGTEIAQFYPDREERRSVEPVLTVTGLGGAKVHDVDLHVGKGEVVGITGLAGSGFEDIPYLVVDPSARARGEVTIDGHKINLRRTTIARRGELGLVLVPADRKNKALAVDLTLRENLVLPRLRSFLRRGGLSRAAEHTDSIQVLKRFGVRPPDSRLAASSLSGGNQQKVVLAKWMSTRPQVLIIHEPTQGVDVGAKSEIFALLAESASQGLSTVLVSVEYEDLAHLCDRVYVVGEGRIVAELSGAQLTTEAITATALMGTERRKA